MGTLEAAIKMSARKFWGPQTERSRVRGSAKRGEGSRCIGRRAKGKGENRSGGEILSRTSQDPRLSNSSFLSSQGPVVCV